MRGREADLQVRKRLHRCVWILLVCLPVLVCALLGGRGGEIMASSERQVDDYGSFTTDFEDKNLRGWTASGSAFANQPTRGDNSSARGREPSNHQGEWWIGVYEDYQGKPGQIAGSIQGDQLTGTLASAPFVIEGPCLSFLIGGGNHPIGDPTGATAVALVIDEEIVLSATGADAETMRRVEWDVSKHIGKTAVIRIIDDNTGRWGHINCDDFRLPTPEVLFEDNFEGATAGDWHLDSGWEVYEESSGNHVLRGEGIWQWAILDQGYTWWTDYTTRFRLKVVRGGVQFNFRLNMPFSTRVRYLAGFGEDAVWLSRETPYNTYYGIDSRGARFALNKWHDIEIIAEGGSFRIFVDGDSYLEATEENPLLQGSIALETLEGPPGAYDTGSVVFLDDVEVVALGDGVSEPSWVRTGGPYGGLGYDIRIRPDNTDIMYVTDALAGVFVSIDGGQSWVQSNEGITSRAGLSSDAIPAFCLTIDPHDHDILWTGMRHLGGIYKSTDGGLKWERMDNGISERVGLGYRGFTVDPRSSDIVYAAAEITSWGWAGEERPGREFDLSKGIVYKTTDGGRNWRVVWRGDNVARYVWIDPRDPDVVYVSTGFFDVEAANSDPVRGIPGGEGILKSIDGGETWFRVNEGLDNWYVGTLFMHPEDPDILLAGTGNYQYMDHCGVYLSEDAGESWEHVLGAVGAPDEYRYIITSVEFSASDPDIAYAGSRFALFRSEDGGRTWNKLSGEEDGWGPEGMQAGIPVDFEVDTQDANRIFANCYNGGNFLSTDGAVTWHDASQGYTGAETRNIVVDPTDPLRVIVVGRSGPFVSHDGGDTWVGIVSPGGAQEFYSIALDPEDPAHILIATDAPIGLLQGVDPALPLRSVGPDLWASNPELGWFSVAFAPSDSSIAYAGTAASRRIDLSNQPIPAEGIYRSANGGHTWRPANDSVSEEAHVMDLAVDYRDPLHVYAATDLGVLQSLDGGQAWVASNTGLPTNVDVLSVVCHPIDPNVVFAGLDRAGVYRSSDGGSSWQAVSAGMNPEAIVSSIVLNPATPKILFAADQMSGVYWSSNSGESWRALSRGLAVREVSGLAIASDGSVLYAATMGGGVYRLDLAGFDWMLEVEDRDGDGVPDDEDYCPDFPGNPGMNGC